MPKSAVRTFSEAAARMINVSVVMTKPVTMVTMVDVWRGLRPKSDRRFLPTFVPTRSPMTAMTPPVMISTSIKTIPYIKTCSFLSREFSPLWRENPPLSCQCAASRIRYAPMRRPATFGSQTA